MAGVQSNGYQLLDGADRQKLMALRAATEDRSQVYGAVLHALVSLKNTYHLQVRTSELMGYMNSTDPFPELGLDIESLRSALDQLGQWGCVARIQDPTLRAQSIAEYRLRHDVWELTAVGTATHRAIVELLGARNEGGSLQRTLFKQIHQSVEALQAAVRRSVAEEVYRALRLLDTDLTDVASGAREFYASVARIAREDDLSDHVFLQYKDQVLAYLQDFGDDLQRNRVVIGATLHELDTNHRASLLSLAAQGDDSVGPFGESADWTQRWDGMLDWFLSGRSGRSEADALVNATSVAIRELLALLRRLTEQGTRPISRATELRTIAAWFARLEDDDSAHELFDAAFGLSPVSHFGYAAPDPESDGRFPSWWTTTPVPVPISLRRYGRRPSRGATARRRDHSGQKSRLELQAQALRRERVAAGAALASIDLSASAIDGEQWALLLEGLSAALANRKPATTFLSTVHTDWATVTLESQPFDTRIRSPYGTLVVRNASLRITSAATTTVQTDVAAAVSPSPPAQQA